MNDNVDFHYEEGTTVDYGCGATLMNEFHYFGGYGSQKRQVLPGFLILIRNSCFSESSN